MGKDTTGTTPATLEDVTFPAQGIDLSCPSAEQTPGTTAVGLNVRWMEPVGLRRRGGQRPGLGRHVDAQASGSSVIQNLNTVVRCDPSALIFSPTVTVTITAHTPNPSDAGQSVTFTISVVASTPASGTPTGAVQLQDDGADIPGATGTLSGGTATIPTSSLTAGTHGNITAIYAGDATFHAATSAAVSQVVGGAGSTAVGLAGGGVKIRDASGATIYTSPSFQASGVPLVDSVDSLYFAGALAVGNGVAAYKTDAFGTIIWSSSPAFASPVSSAVQGVALSGGVLYVAYVRGGTPRLGVATLDATTGALIDAAYQTTNMPDGGPSSFAGPAIATSGGYLCAVGRSSSSRAQYAVFDLSDGSLVLRATIGTSSVFSGCMAVHGDGAGNFYVTGTQDILEGFVAKVAGSTGAVTWLYQATSPNATFVNGALYDSVNDRVIVFGVRLLGTSDSVAVLTPSGSFVSSSTPQAFNYFYGWIARDTRVMLVDEFGDLRIFASDLATVLFGPLALGGKQSSQAIFG